MKWAQEIGLEELIVLLLQVLALTASSYGLKRPVAVLGSQRPVLHACDTSQAPAEIESHYT